MLKGGIVEFCRDIGWSMMAIAEMERPQRQMFACFAEAMLLQLDERFFELKQGATGHGSGSSKVRQQWPAGWDGGSGC